MKTVFKRNNFLVLLILLFLTTFMSACGDKAVLKVDPAGSTMVSQTSNTPQQKSFNLSVKDNQLFLNDEKLTASSGEKFMEQLSPDKKKVSYIYSEGESNKQLGIIDVETKKDDLIKIDEIFSQILLTEWLSSNKIGVVSHINPNKDLYSIYDAQSLSQISSYFGFGFVFNKAKTDILYLSAEAGTYTLNLNDTILYSAEEGKEVDSSIYPNPDFKRIAFYERSNSENNSSDLIILTLEKNEVKAKKVIPWNKDMPEIKWVDENTFSPGDYEKIELR